VNAGIGVLRGALGGEAEYADAGVHRLVVLAPDGPDGPAKAIENATTAVAAL